MRMWIFAALAALSSAAFAKGPTPLFASDAPIRARDFVGLAHFILVAVSGKNAVEEPDRLVFR